MVLLLPARKRKKRRRKRRRKRRKRKRKSISAVVVSLVMMMMSGKLSINKIIGAICLFVEDIHLFSEGFAIKQSYKIQSTWVG